MKKRLISPKRQCIVSRMHCGTHGKYIHILDDEVDFTAGSPHQIHHIDSIKVNAETKKITIWVVSIFKT